MLVGFIHDKSNFSLDAFDEPVKNFLDSELKELGFDPRELLPVIDIAIEEAKRLVYEEKLPLLPPSILKSRIEEHAYIYTYGVLTQSKKWKSALERIKSYHSVFLIGAGISFESGIPLTSVLNDLLKFCGAKNYEELREDDQKCLKFKLEFKKICDDKEPSTSHKLIALNFPKYILEIICLNWDNLIERAFRENNKLFSKVNEDNPVSNKRFLWKFHGDVENIKSDNIKGKGGWVFPDEDGYVFNCFLKYIEESELKNSIFTFIIVGYSEKEKEVYEKIIECFERKPERPTFRIGLNLKRLHEENYIVGPSDFILKKILPLTS